MLIGRVKEFDDCGQQAVFDRFLSAVDQVLVDGSKRFAIDDDSCRNFRDRGLIRRDLALAVAE